MISMVSEKNKNTPCVLPTIPVVYFCINHTVTFNLKRIIRMDGTIYEELPHKMLICNDAIPGAYRSQYRHRTGRWGDDV